LSHLWQKPAFGITQAVQKKYVFDKIVNQSTYKPDKKKDKTEYDENI